MRIIGHTNKQRATGTKAFVRGLASLLLAALLCTVSPAAAQQRTHTEAQASSLTETDHVQQQVDLAQGWNFVSLSVLPDNASMDAVLAPVLSDIVLVKDRNGHTYSPMFGIYDFSIWDSRQAYQIHAQRSVTFSVTGAPIAPDTASIALQEGWNLAPYFGSTALAVEEALATIEADLTLAQDEAGQQYYPAQNITTLKSMGPGEGYLLHTQNAATLTYPATGTDGSSSTFTAATLAEARALTGLQVGDQVEVLGYHEAGDGGGGIFVVDDSGAPTDGGTCVGFAEHEAVGTFTIDTATLQSSGGRLPHSALSWGNLRLYYNASGDYLTDWQLNGHSNSGPESNLPYLDYATGTVRDQRGSIRYLASVDGTTSVRYEYKYLTSNLRLKRQDVGTTFNLRWFGATPSTDAAPVEITQVLRTVINVAHHRKATTVYVPAGTWFYYGPVEIRDGITITGDYDSGTGTWKSVLKVMPNKALEHTRNDYNPEQPSTILRQIKTLFIQHGDAASLGFKDIELDGNWKGNTDPWENRSSYGDIENEMRNAMTWAGISVSNADGHPVQPYVTVTAENLHVHGFGALLIGGHANVEWTGKNVKLGNTLYNHHMYASNGVFTDLTWYGFAWGYSALFANTFYNFTVENLTSNPYYADLMDLLNYRGPEPGGSDPRHDPTIGFKQTGLIIDGFTIDMRGGKAGAVFSGVGHTFEVRNGTVHGRENSEIYLARESGNGWQQGLYTGWMFENIVVHQYGYPVQLSSDLHVTESAFPNINLITETQPDADYGIPIFDLRAFHRDAPEWDTPQQIYLSDIRGDFGHTHVLRTDVDENAAGLDIFLTQSSLNNTGSQVVVNKSNNGKLSDITGDATKVRLFMEDVTFNLKPPFYVQEMELFETVLRFKNSSTQNGRTSEDSGTIYYTASGGETYIDTATNLFWVPAQVNVVEGAGSEGLFSRHEVIYDNDVQDGYVANGPYKSEPSLRLHLTRPLQTGETVEFTWNAAVRPFEQGSTPSL